MLERVRKKDITICVLGLGRVGLPLATVFANRGVKTIGIDVDQNKINLIKNSKSPFHDPALQQSLEKSINSGNLIIKSSLESLEKNPDIIILTVGTPNTVIIIVSIMLQPESVDTVRRYAVVNIGEAMVLGSVESAKPVAGFHK